jgi:DNA-binding GntR family transcriptional regulator
VFPWRSPFFFKDPIRPQVKSVDTFTQIDKLPFVMPPPTPTPGRRQNLAEEVTRQLRREIVLGEIKPGTPLAEPVLAARYGASRAPIREALIALERDGLVEFNERSRTRVRPLTAEDFQEICTMRIALESLAARLAAQSWDSARTRTVEENLALQETAATLGELSHLDVEMHASIVRLSGHRRLISAWSGIRWQFEMGLAYTHRLQQKLAFEPRRITVDSHRHLLASLSSGQPEFAAKTMSTHIESSLEWSLAKFPVEPSDSLREGETSRKTRAVSAATKSENPRLKKIPA